MENADFYAKYTAQPVEWPTLTEGPWLKPTVARCKTTLEMSEVHISEPFTDAAVTNITFTVRNKGKYPSPITFFDIDGAKALFFSSDAYFWLEPGESREISMTVKLREPATTFKVALRSWNAKKIVRTLQRNKP